MSMSFEKIYDMVCDELDEIGKSNVTMSNSMLERIDKLTHIKKNMLKIMSMEGGEGYSNSGDWEARGRFGHGSSYEDGGSSYARKRDSMGRYSRSEGKSRAVETLRAMLDDADSEADRDAINRCMRALRGE